MAPTLNLKSWEEGSSGEAESKGSYHHALLHGVALCAPLDLSLPGGGHQSLVYNSPPQ